MKTLKVKADKEEINIELEEEELKEIVPPYYTKTKKLDPTTIVTKEDIENANNPKYYFKRMLKIMFLSFLFQN